MFAYRSDAETNEYQSWVPKHVSEVEQFISRNPEQFNLPDTWFQLVLFELESQEIIGDIGVHFIDEDQVELGCTLAKQYQGKAYANEALTCLIDYLFNKLNKHRIIASIDPLNSASQKMIERLGFRKEAHFKQSLFFKGKWVDDLVYAVLNEEWKVRHF